MSLHQLGHRRDGEILATFLDVFVDDRQGGLTCYFRREDGLFCHVHERQLGYYKHEHQQLLDPRHGDRGRQNALSPQRRALIAREAAECTKALHKLNERHHAPGGQPRPFGDIANELFARLRHNARAAEHEAAHLLDRLLQKPKQP